MEDELQANAELAVAHFPADSWTQAERRSNPVTINGPVLGFFYITGQFLILSL